MFVECIRGNQRRVPGGGGRQAAGEEGKGRHQARGHGNARSLQTGIKQEIWLGFVLSQAVCLGQVRSWRKVVKTDLFVQETFTCHLTLYEAQ